MLVRGTAGMLLLQEYQVSLHQFTGMACHAALTSVIHSFRTRRHWDHWECVPWDFQRWGAQPG